MEHTEHSHQRASLQQFAEKPNNNRIIVLAIIGAIVVIILGGIAAWVLKPADNTSSVIETSKYQAVFLTNGQDYFGKLQALNSNYFKLTDIYYLQAPQSDSTSTNTTTTDANQKLIKLGNELHGPEDEMVISKEQVLFFENLKSDSKVSKLIDQNQKK